MISQKTKTMYFIIGITLLILILGIWWCMTNNKEGYNIKEGYNNQEDKDELIKKSMELAQLKMKKDKTFVDEMNIEIYEKTLRLEEDAVEVADALEDAIDEVGDVGDDVFGAIESEVIREEKKKKMPEWRDVYGAGDKPTHIMNVKYRPDTSKIINDSCSTKGFLTSEYKEDICKKYQGDYGKINEKCNRLSNENCKIPSCCVLLNDSKCAAGNIHGPTYLTEQGKSIDYDYYHYKGKCYGKCDRDNNSLSKCAKYANNSTGVSKECMIQMFNNMGCPNKNPEELINDDIVRDFSRSSRRYITNYLEEAVRYMKKHSDKDESRILCYGPTKKCDRFKDHHMNVTKDCIEEMLTESSCPRTTITESEEIMYRKYTKENIRYDTNVCHMGVNHNPAGADAGTPGAGTPGTSAAGTNAAGTSAAGTSTSAQTYNQVNDNVNREVTILTNKINEIVEIYIATNRIIITDDDMSTIQTSTNSANSYIQNYINSNNSNTNEERELNLIYENIKSMFNDINNIINNSDSTNIEVTQQHRDILNEQITEMNNQIN